MRNKKTMFCGVTTDYNKLRDVVEVQAVDRMVTTLTMQNVHSVMNTATETGDHIYWLAGLVAVHNMHIMGDI